MQLIRKVSSFGSNPQELVHLWKIFCLSVLEQSCVVWGGMITSENKKDLECPQKNFTKLALHENFTNYRSALLSLGLNFFEEKRQILKKNPKTGHFQVTRAHTERFRKSPILTMQRLLNNDRRNTN